jgi:hypothetical protein
MAWSAKIPPFAERLVGCDEQGSRRLLDEFQPLAPDRRHEIDEADGISAGMRDAFHDAVDDRVSFGLPVQVEPRCCALLPPQPSHHTLPNPPKAVT